MSLLCRAARRSSVATAATWTRAQRRPMSILNADDGKVGTKVYHYLNLTLLAAFPAAVITSPSPLTKPIDVVLGIAMPLHAHVGINYVISDYVPKGMRVMARAGLVGATSVAILGLLRLNFMGDGLTASTLSLWNSKDKKEE